MGSLVRLFYHALFLATAKFQFFSEFDDFSGAGGGVGVGARAPLYAYIKFSSKLTYSRRARGPPPPPYAPTYAKKAVPGGPPRGVSVNFIKNLTFYRARKGAKPGRTPHFCQIQKKIES